jgi:biopolymer transport protein ExbD
LLSVNKDLQYYVNNKQVQFDQIQSVIAKEAGLDKDAFVVLRCDNSLPIQQLVNLLQIGNQLNVKMVLATKKE